MSTLTTIISTLSTSITLTTSNSTLDAGVSTYLRLESATAERSARAAHAAACPPADWREGSCSGARPHAPVELAHTWTEWMRLNAWWRTYETSDDIGGR